MFKRQFRRHGVSRQPELASRAALNRLLDEEDTSLTLTTLASAAAALGKINNLQLATVA